jgi:hypothetical protein
MINVLGVVAFFVTHVSSRQSAWANWRCELPTLQPAELDRSVSTLTYALARPARKCRSAKAITALHRRRSV